jgi:hypothetical protein
MRHRFLPFPCLRLVRSGTASGGSRILSAEPFTVTYLPLRKSLFRATASSSLVFQHLTDRSKSGYTVWFL